jgi:hypothetical protein
MLSVFLLATVVSFILNLLIGMLFGTVMSNVKTIDDISGIAVFLLVAGFVTKYATYIFLALTIAKFISELF